MLVDDSDADNVFHRIVLEAAGFRGELFVHDSPVAALEAIRSGGVRPDLLLLDINMPQLNGFGFAQRLQDALPAPAWPKVVMLSSSSLDEDRERALAIPIVRGYITKPLTLQQAHRLQAGEGPVP
jgi:CheY-like chemotaxis protein